MELIKSLLYCPLTKLVFKNPVIAEDGHTYECMAIQDWLENHNTSPKTNEEIGYTLIKSSTISDMIDQFMTEYPELKEDQFMTKKPYYLFNEEFMTKLNNYEFENLVCYTEIMLNDNMPEKDTTVCEWIFIYNDDNEITKKLIDNSIDYDTHDDNGTKPIHHACKLSNQEIIKYLIENKSVVLNELDAKGNQPIHYLTKYQKNISEIATHFFEESDMRSMNNHGLMPIHILAKNITSWDTIVPFLNTKQELELVSEEGMTPLHYLCKYCGDINIIINYLNIENIILDAEVRSCEKTAFDLIYENESLEKKNKQALLYIYLSKVLIQTKKRDQTQELDMSKQPLPENINDIYVNKTTYEEDLQTHTMDSSCDKSISESVKETLRKNPFYLDETQFGLLNSI